MRYSSSRAHGLSVRVLHAIGLALFILGLTTLGAQAETQAPAEDDLEIKSKKDDVKRYDDSFYTAQGTKVVLNKFYDKEWKHELFFHGAGMPFGSVYYGYGGGFSYTFHFSDNWGWEAVHAQYLHTFFSGFAADPLLAEMQINKPKATIMTNVIWNGAYGKLRLFGLFIWRFDLYALAGLGVAMTKNGNEPTGGFGIGARGFMGKYFALRIEIRDFIHRNVLTPTKNGGALATTEIKNNFVIIGGISIYLPGFERFEDE